MTPSPTPYTIGPGRPPLHTRFKKGQSGNPGGKPGPAKLANMRFQRALLAALEMAPDELAGAQPETVLDALAFRLARDAVAGRVSSVRQVLSVIDGAKIEEEAGVRGRSEAGAFSLVEGESQGEKSKSLEEMLWPDAPELWEGEDEESGDAPERNRAGRSSLPQGESQGGGAKSAGVVLQEKETSPASLPVSGDTPAKPFLEGRGSGSRGAAAGNGATEGPGTAQAVSLLQGESQGEKTKSPEEISWPEGLDREQAFDEPNGGRAQVAKRSPARSTTAVWRSSPRPPDVVCSNGDAVLVPQQILEQLQRIGQAGNPYSREAAGVM